MTFISGRRGRAARGPPGTVTAAAQELDALGDDLDRLALGAILCLPLAPVEAAVDRDGAPLAQVLRATLGLVAEDRDAEVVRLVDPLPRLVLSPAVHGDPKTADGGAARRVPKLWIAGQVPYENDPVDACCHGPTPPRPQTCSVRLARSLRPPPAPPPAPAPPRGPAALSRPVP